MNTPDPRSMSFQNAVLTLLDQKGIGKEEADPILAAVQKDPTMKDMDHRWNDRVGEYPPLLLTTIWHVVCQHTLAWMDKDVPLHWARPFFTAEKEAATPKDDL